MSDKFINYFGNIQTEDNNYIDVAITGYDLQNLLKSLAEVEQEQCNDEETLRALRVLLSGYINPQRLSYTIKVRIPKNVYAFANLDKNEENNDK